MIRALLAGRKVQTRRPVKFPVIDRNVGCELAGNELAGEIAAGNYYNSKYGKPGDRLWVRETWMPDAPRDGTWADVEFYGCKCSPLSMIPNRYRKPEHCIHRASWEGSEMVGWTPSIHMPRWASRITLDITGVRVERLQAISEDDAKAEGMIPEACDHIRRSCEEIGCCGDTARGEFSALWTSIYGADSWKANPWVWVVEFKRLEAGQ